MAWTALDTLVFSGLANGAAIAPTAYASPSTGQAWTDVKGGVYAINGGALVGTTDTVDGAQFKRDFLIGGSATDEINSRILATTTTDALMCTRAVLRYQRTGVVGNCYFGGYNVAAGQVNIYAITGTGNSTPVILATGSTGPITGHQYAMDFSAIGTNPTVLTLTFYDLAGGSVTITASDSTANLQQAGAMGLNVANTTGAATAQVNKFAQLQTFSYVPPVAVNLPQSNILFPAQGWDQSTSGHAIATRRATT